MVGKMPRAFLSGFLPSAGELLKLFSSIKTVKLRLPSVLPKGLSLDNILWPIRKSAMDSQFSRALISWLATFRTMCECRFSRLTLKMEFRRRRSDAHQREELDGDNLSCRNEGCLNSTDWVESKN
jgi:hypothetical protein